MNCPLWFFLYFDQPNASTQHSTIGWIISYSDYFCVLIDWPLSLFLYFNSQFQVTPMHALSIPILDGWSTTLIIPPFQYWFLCQPNLCIHCLGIGWVIGCYDYSCISILSSESAICIHSAFKYWLDDQLLSLFLHFNIGFFVSLIYAFTVSILNQWLATLIIPVF